MLAFKRILLKLSGEVLMGAQPHGIDLDTVGRLADEVLACAATGTQVALVIGGGNIWRGVAGAAQGQDRGPAYPDRGQDPAYPDRAQESWARSGPDLASWASWEEALCQVVVWAERPSYSLLL